MIKKNECPLGVRLNNPCNIRFSRFNNWLGQNSNYKGFVKFNSVAYGLRAFFILYRNYIANGYNTTSKFISRYAPSADKNNTKAYIDFVCNFCHITPYTVLSYDLAPLFCYAIMRMEIGPKYANRIVLNHSEFSTDFFYKLFN